MPLKVWDGTAFKEVSTISVWNGTSFSNVANAYSWNGSAWTQWYPSVHIGNVFARDLSKAGVGGTGSATYRLSVSGVASRTINPPNATLVPITGQWLVSGNASDYEVRGTLISSFGAGILTTPGPGWNPLDTTRDWSLSTTNNAAIREILIEIRPIGSTSVATSGTIELEVDSAP